MNIATDLIERDHRAVEEVFDEFHRRPHRSLTFDVCTLLERHTRMEEEILYPVLAEVDDELHADATQEHREADELVEEIRSTSDRGELRELMAQLEETVRHHIADEEQEDLPRMEDELGVARMNELGIEMLEWQHRDDRDGEDAEELLELTRDELYRRAQEADISGRSNMNKRELAEVLANG